MDIYRKLNRALQTGGDWTGHEAAVRRLLDEALARRPGRRQALVLGVGNGRDLPLDTLAQEFPRVVLIDIDGETLRNTAGRWRGRAPAVRWETVEADLSGLHELVRTWHGWPSPGILEAVLAGVPDVPAALEPWTGTADLVLSVGVATQLVAPVVGDAFKTRPETWPRTQADLLFTAAARRHCSLIRRLLAPGGVAVLATEVLSTEGVPRARHKEFLELAARRDPEWQKRLLIAFPEAPVIPGVLLVQACLPASSGPGVHSWIWRLSEQKVLVMAGWVMNA